MRPRAPRRSALSIDVLVESPQWSDLPEAPAAVRKAIAAAAREISSPGGEVAVMLTSDAALRRLNRKWRRIDKPTNVLSFPALQPTGTPSPDDAPRMLGDIAIAYETMRREADDEQKPFDHHLSHLAIHGFLHLIGFDHETDQEAEEMEALERKILAQLGIPDPYAPQQRTT